MLKLTFGRLEADIKTEEDLFTLLLVLDDEDNPDPRVEDLKQHITGMKQRLKQLVMNFTWYGPYM